MAQLDEFNKEVWSDQSIFRVENHIINNIFACRTTDAVEAAITYRDGRKGMIKTAIHINRMN